MNDLQNEDKRAAWFGHVPSSWKLARNKNALRLVSKKVGEAWQDFDLLSLTLKGVIKRDIESGKGKFPDSFETYQQVKRNDLILCLFDIDETPRSVGLSSHEGMITGAYSVFECTKFVEPRFVNYFYLSIDQRKGLRPFYTGLRKVVRTDTFLNAAFPTPDLETQKAIADFLDRETARIDALIEKKEKLAELVKESELAYIARKFSKLEARKWRVRHLGKLKNGAGFPVDLQGDPSQEIAFFKVKHLKVHGLDAAITETTDTVSKETATSLRATVFPKGTIVLAKIGAALLLGRFSMLGRPACIDNNMSAFVPTNGLIEPNFALLGLSQADMTTMVQPGAVPSLSTEAFYNFGIPLPTKDAQIKFVDEVRSWRSTTMQIVEKTQQSISRLQEFRSALITAAVTGQIDVNSWGKTGQTERQLDQIGEASA